MYKQQSRDTRRTKNTQRVHFDGDKMLQTHTESAEHANQCGAGMHYRLKHDSNLMLFFFSTLKKTALLFEILLLSLFAFPGGGSVDISLTSVCLVNTLVCWSCWLGAVAGRNSTKSKNFKKRSIILPRVVQAATIKLDTNDDGASPDVEASCLHWSKH